MEKHVYSLAELAHQLPWNTVFTQNDDWETMIVQIWVLLMQFKVHINLSILHIGVYVYMCN